MTSPAVHELVLNRFIPFPPAMVYRAWTDPTLITQWFTPAPWKTTVATTDVRAGGSSFIEMQGPEGEGTRYIARVRHWSAEDKQMHEQMGFEPGWHAATDQMIALLGRLA